jgi:hypothetical protein
MSQNNNDQALWEALKSMAFIGVNALLGGWLVCQWLTRLLFEHLLNPLLKGALDRHDGLVIALAGGLWSLVFMLLFGWQVKPETPAAAQTQTFWVFVGAGAAYGVSIGTWILLIWWSQVEPLLERVYEPVERLDEPLRVISSPAKNGPSAPPSADQLTQELDEVLGRRPAVATQPDLKELK